ncbi:MAG: DUF423 domain-containing protein [marine benthic group bacterium]|nr:DUF423 domain-containing protein [Candidatus Benthicola marisminoris]
MYRKYLLIGAILAGTGVASGAFGAHALETRLTPDLLAVYETGVRYGLMHALAILIAALACERWPAAGWGRAVWSFVLGIALFSGSLVALALTGLRVLGAVTPLGGICFLVGWGFTARAAVRSGSN